MPSPRSKKTRICIGQHTQNEYQQDSIEVRQLDEGATLSGIAPQCKLVSLKVLDDNGDGGSTDVIAALQYVREVVNGNGKMQRIHGVNLSLGYEFDPKWFACGQSPLCVEVDRLVRSGVVVVVAAGNTGYGYLNAEQRQTRTGLTLTINDPGNANLAITVGATHRYMPHVYGVSYFSSKGPTGDGRLKPDLVAPGERITSCAVGQMRDTMPGAPLADNVAAYIDDTGTSMAAPHVSGAIAAFLSIRSEYIGRPEDVKQVFLDSATSLGRERYFEGHGLVDLMRAIQSV
jgi:subtilisin family serine protease